MVVGVLAILKAGAAYVAMDPAFPRAHLEFMIEDSGVAVMLANERLAAGIANMGTRVCPRDELGADRAKGNASRAIDTEENDVAYVIYTSGSTGRPKGVLGLHRGVINRCAWMWHEYPFGSDEICCQKTALSFVDLVWEIFGPLLRGMRSIIIPEHISINPRALVDCLAEKMVTRLVLVPSLLRAILDDGRDSPSLLPSLRYCISSGEALRAELALRCYEKMPAVTILNLYGSTEVSADVTCYPVPRRLPDGTS